MAIHGVPTSSVPLAAGSESMLAGESVVSLASAEAARATAKALRIALSEYARRLPQLGLQLGHQALAVNSMVACSASSGMVSPATKQSST